MEDIIVSTADNRTLETKIDEISNDLNISADDVRRMLTNDPKLAIQYLECLLLKQSVGSTYQATQAIEYFERKAKNLEEIDDEESEKSPKIRISSKDSWWQSDTFTRLLVMAFMFFSGVLLTLSLTSETKPVNTSKASNHSFVLPVKLP